MRDAFDDLFIERSFLHVEDTDGVEVSWNRGYTDRNPYLSSIYFLLQYLSSSTVVAWVIYNKGKYDTKKS